jgi:hypothetical protein
MNSSYAEEKLRLAAGELKGSPNRKKLHHVVLRTLVAVNESDFPDHLRPKYEAIRSMLLREGRLSVSRLSAEEVRQVWRRLRELCRETVGS